MENQIVLPEIVPLEYNGKRVLATKQLSQLFGCKTYSITTSFSRHKEIFKYGEDYYFLEGEEMKEFKKQFQRNLFQGNYQLIGASIGAQGNYQLIASLIGVYSNHVYLWTGSGVFKLSKIIGTEMAKIIFSQLKLGYFQALTPDVTPQNVSQSDVTPFNEIAVLPPPNESINPGVYAFAMEDNTVKIGMSNNVPDRAKTIEYETHLKITNVFYRTVENRKKALEIEKALHKHFAAQCTQGEFFSISFEDACKQIENLVDAPTDEFKT